MSRVVAMAIGLVLVASAGWLWHAQTVTITKDAVPQQNALETNNEPNTDNITSGPTLDPRDVRALYVPAPVFADPQRRKELIATAHASNANALVIDVKDTTGVVMPDDLGSWVQEVRDADLFPIARVVVFQDNAFAKSHPQAALQNKDGSLWVHKGLHWLDPAAPESTDHTLEVAKKAVDLGFREINLDYVRFPTDGNLDAIHFPVYVRDTPRAPIIAEAIARIRAGIKEKDPAVILSADLYAFSFIVKGDVGIGQQITILGPHLDVIAPMIYPSHYGPGNFGFSNPAAHPYEVTDGTLASGISMLNTLPVEQRPIVRPWIQTFDMGAEYTPALVTASRQAVIDNTGHDSWFAWNASARYEPAGLKKPITAKKKEVVAPSSTQP